MKGITFGALLVFSGACTFRLDVDPKPTAERDAEPAGDGDGDEPSEEATPYIPVTRPMKNQDAGNDGGGDAGQDAGQVMRPFVMHALCNEYPNEEELPPLRLNLSPNGRPGFDYWRVLACDSALVRDYPLCTLDDVSGSPEWSCGHCALSSTGIGVCAPDQSYGEECELLTSRGGLCAGCAPIVAKARVCCGDGGADFGEFDCRPWPFPSDSKRGESCARHDDCEPGLVCKTFGGHGRCSCPEEPAPNLYRFTCADAGGI